MKHHFVSNIIIMLALLLSACTPSIPISQSEVNIETPATNSQVPAREVDEEDVLYLNLTWHQHQPLYYKDDMGVYTRPWVRVHATKDYYDMAATVEKYPNVHVTFNLTPVLIRQLDDFTINGARDYYWVLSEKPVSELTFEEKDFILRRFFDANWDHVIKQHPGYAALLNKRAGITEENIQAALSSFTEQDFRDLQIWFNLAWMDPDLLSVDPLLALVEKDHGFAEADKVILFKEVKRIMAEVIPVHRRMLESGQIEVITTPYAHPILPLIYDTNLAKIGNPDAEMPERFSYVQDVMTHLDRSVEVYRDHFGKAPTGMWPGEGAVAQEIVPFVSKAGYQWMASGEQVLANSLGIGAFTRDSNDTVLEADALYRPYVVSGPADGPVQGEPVVMVFRDLLISDKLGFTYSGTPGEEAAANFMERMENIRAELKKEGATGPHLVSIILDGENAWEYYDNDGKEFLNALYRKLNESKTVKTITVTEYMQKFPEQNTLDTLFPGAWFSANYDTWIGEHEETLGWEYLRRVRKDLAQYDFYKKKTTSSPEALAEALDYMYLAEGSDWFWWYGADQDSGNDAYFDQGFRALLAKVYEALGEPVPEFVKVPIIPAKDTAASTPFKGVFTPVIDGTLAEGEWDNASSFFVQGGSQARSEDVTSAIYFGMDKTNGYIRVDLKDDVTALADGKLGIYLSSPRLQASSGVTINSEGKSEPTILGFGAVLLVEVDLATGKTVHYTPAGNIWKPIGELETVKSAGNVTEISFPLSLLGEVETGDDIRFRVVASSAQRDLQVVPADGPGKVVMPDISTLTTILEIEDPVGDDYGPGSYTYPTDGVFVDAAFDMTSLKLGYDEKNVVFQIGIAGQINNPWSGGAGISLQTIDVYVDQDPGAGTGASLLLPGRNAALKEGYGWDVAVWAESWTPQVVKPDMETKEPKQVSASSYKIITDSANSTITLRVPRGLFADTDPSTWSFAVLMLSQDGYPANGVWRVRDIEAASAQWRFGGAPPDTNHTRIIDLIWPVDQAGTQEAMLSTYPASQQPLGQLTAADFPMIDMLFASSK